MSKKVEQISLALIDDPHTPMRSTMDEESLQELIGSIRRHGLMQPITVRKIGQRYEVIAGHRRLTALKRMREIFVDCIVVKAENADADEMRMAENLYRENINPVDEARYIRKMVEEHNVDPAKLAQMIGKSEVYLQARYDLLDYPPYLVDALEKEQIGLTAAQWLAKIDDDRVRAEYTRFAISGGITAVRARAWYDSWRAGHVPTIEGAIVIPDRTEAGEPIPIYDYCRICRTREDIRHMSMHYAHDSCIEAIARASMPAASTPDLTGYTPVDG